MARELLVMEPNVPNDGDIVASKIDNALSFQQQALGLRAYRQQVLAGNIANADTPNYKARDFDFASALKEAVAGRGEGSLPVARTDSAHLAGTGESGPVRLMYRTPVQSSAVAPLLIRWMKPSAASPSGFQPVTRCTASGLQYVRTS